MSLSAPSAPELFARASIAGMNFLSSQLRLNDFDSLTVLKVLCDGAEETPTSGGDSESIVRETTGIAETVEPSEAARMAGTVG